MFRLFIQNGAHRANRIIAQGLSLNEQRNIAKSLCRIDCPNSNVCPVTCEVLNSFRSFPLRVYASACGAACSSPRAPTALQKAKGTSESSAPDIAARCLSSSTAVA